MPADGATWTLSLEAKNLLGTTDREFGYSGCGGWLVFTVPRTATEWTSFTVSSERCSTASSGLGPKYRSDGGWSSGSDAVDLRNIKLFKAASVTSCCLGPSCQACPAGTYKPFSASELSPYWQHLARRWRVDGCTSNTNLVADPVLTDVSAATGKVVCCRGEYAATRDASSGVCLGGQVSKTFLEAKTI